MAHESWEFQLNGFGCNSKHSRRFFACHIQLPEMVRNPYHPISIFWSTLKNMQFSMALAGISGSILYHSKKQHGASSGRAHSQFSVEKVANHSKFTADACVHDWFCLGEGCTQYHYRRFFLLFVCEDILMAGVTVWISFSTWIRFESFSKYIFCSLLLLLHFEGSIVFLHQCLQQHIKHTFQFFNLVAPSIPISTSVLTLYRLNATYSDQTEMDSIVIYFNLFACIIGWVHYSPSSISITRNGARISNESHVPAPVMKFLGKISLTFHLFPFRNDRDNRQTNHTARVFH